MHLSSIIQHSKQPFVIAGPCSVESEEQMLQIAQKLSQLPIQMLRGGIWKPRTRPNSFEGIGSKGLPWLIAAGKMAKIPVATEVANVKHVEAALEAGVDALWIGARTTANPFAIEDIAKSLKGITIPVLVKNPINPDLQLWIGAIERLKNNGINDIIAVHRGFSVYQHPRYRNDPKWKIPIGLMEELPEIPILCDPSHISGKAEGIYPISQKAMDLNFSGLMIESHPNPKEALSDSEQQLTPQSLQILLKNIILRDQYFKSGSTLFIEEKRKEIEQIDEQIFQYFKERMQIADQIGQYKKKHKITILQTEHWKKMIAYRLGQSTVLQLTPEFLRTILDAVHQESIRHQTGEISDQRQVKK